jgi:hypothetical protein
MSYIIDVVHTTILDRNINSTVEVGIFGDTGSKVLYKAVVNEFGKFPLIPSRPFIRYTMDTHADKINKFIDKEVGRMVEKNYSPEKTLARIGEYVKRLIVKTINTSKAWATPNSPVTIKIKGSDQPLVNTGEMRSKITYRVQL